MARQEHEELAMGYSEAPQNLYSPATVDLDSFMRTTHDSYAPTVAFDATGAPLYAAESVQYMYHGGSSPGLYADDDMRVPSSDLSTASATSSNMGSPLSSHGQLAPMHDWAQGLGLNPGIVDHAEFMTAGAEYQAIQPTLDGLGAAFDFTTPSKQHYVDPSLIHPDVRTLAMPFESTYPPPNSAYPASPTLSASPQLRPDSVSPFIQNTGFPQFSPPYHTLPVDSQGKRRSMASFPASLGDQVYSGDESREKQRCADCGKPFKDLKAHMLTHQTERPEKCPIASCEWNTKGFARKYDKNRHTLTHYKGTMVCGFCPGSGTANEKSFNRADVFKRHLTAMHGVEQIAPNSRKKAPGTGSSGKKLTAYAPDATGKCSTCSQTFSNAQDFYEHLDDCVLRVVQQTDPGEEINAMQLDLVANDPDVRETLEKNNLLTSRDSSTASSATIESATVAEDDEMAGGGGDEDGDDDEAEEESHGSSGSGRGGATKPSSPVKKTSKNGNPVNGVQKSRGMTHSTRGVQLTGKHRGRKNRRDYPSSWGFDKGQMTMKKRVAVVFDGPRRLAKDDMMLSTEHEVRVKLSDGKRYVTDLDVQTLRRTEAFLNATEDEKGPWISDELTEDDRRKILECSPETIVNSQ